MSKRAEETPRPDASTQLRVVERIRALVEQAKELVADEACLDALDGSEAEDLAEVQSRLIDAAACLRSLSKQLKARGGVRS